ncbi:amidohydrolase [Bordetella sp. BOR01]|uniref:amidohydrolase family protein n=1 Tax=Bordetella sp. BOR01 TaxID=2854779 RepID=UPI001C4424FE|nr:amidohydrolase family protein [Bordetella sp. BOR01]MBV7486847.1 amidohydrolase family protein [Bordetella sp. BOR01]
MPSPANADAEGPVDPIDCHAHIFDPVRYPFHASGTYDLHPAEIGDAVQYRAVLDANGVGRAVLINPLGGYGLDNRYMMEAIAHSQGRFRGIAVVPTDIAEADARALYAQGIQGIRFSLHHPSGPSLGDGNGQRILQLAHDAGWKVLIHYTGDLLVAAMPLLRESRATLVIDHCGRPSVPDGLKAQGFSALLELGRQRRHYIKLSGVFRFSQQPWPHEDVEPYVKALVEAFGIDHCIWGSDWPFTRMDRRVDYGPLYALMWRWFPDRRDRDLVLCGNPARLFFADSLATQEAP